MRYEIVQVTRDLHTKYSRAFPPWEIAVLEHLFEDGNVLRTGEYETIRDDRGYPDARVEFARLSKVYGKNPENGVEYVAEVFGQSRAGIHLLEQQIEMARQVDDEHDAEVEAARAIPRTRYNVRRFERDPLLA
jgi:hypothetical protein